MLLLLSVLGLSQLPRVYSILNVTGLWAGDNFAEFYVNGQMPTRKLSSWDRWDAVKSIDPIILDQDEAILQFVVRNEINGAADYNPATLFANIVVNGKLYSTTGDGNWLSTVTNDIRLDMDAAAYPGNPLICKTGTPSVWERTSSQITSNLAINGVKPQPIWEGTETCDVLDEQRTFALAVSSKVNSSEAKRLWQNGLLFPKPPPPPNAAIDPISAAKPTNEAKSDNVSQQSDGKKDYTVITASVAAGAVVFIGAAFVVAVVKRRQSRQRSESFNQFNLATVAVPGMPTSGEYYSTASHASLPPFQTTPYYAAQ